MNDNDAFNPLYMQFECRPDFCLRFYVANVRIDPAMTW